MSPWKASATRATCSTRSLLGGFATMEMHILRESLLSCTVWAGGHAERDRSGTIVALQCLRPLSLISAKVCRRV